MKQIAFTVKGEPVGKGRPRFTKAGHCYTPEKTASYEALVGFAYRNSARGYTFEYPVRVTIKAFFKPPKSKSKKAVEDMLSGRVLPAKKPDIDNIVKIILDGLNKVAWKDDTQVIDLMIQKRYSMEPMVAVLIEGIEEEGR